MGSKTTIILACSILLLLFLIPAAAGALTGSQDGSYRVGKSVWVGPEEKLSGGLLAAGANIEIAGEIQGGLKAFAANVSVPGEIKKELITAGANVILGGKFRDKVRVWGANIVLSGTFDGDVEVTGAKVTLGSGARIEGNLIYTAPVLVRQGTPQVVGKVIPRRETDTREWVQKLKELLTFLGVLYWVIAVPGLILVGGLLNYLLPGQTEAIIKILSESPWKGLGVGLVFILLVPLGILVSLASLIGIPLGMIAALLYGIALYLSRIFVGVWIGRKILGYFPGWKASAYFWPLVLGTILTTLLIHIPVLGWLFKFFFILLGAGAMWTALWKSIQGRGAAV